ncbi:MAG: hypothetical protein JWP97_5063 [Labilithrix sp.]|nr:hypothetical protein [Labilithrix sp.]
MPALLAALASACSSSGGDGSPPVETPPAKIVKPAPTPLPALASVSTTASATFAPAHAIQKDVDGPNPAFLPASLDDYLARGFGDLTSNPGDKYVARAIDGSMPLPPGPNAKRLLRFAHLADLQLSDDESPTRLGTFDSASITSAALRPQDPDICRMTNAAVRTLNALHRSDPIAFTLLGGDSADSAQSNEVDWVLQILGGSPLVQCDSGDVDDPVAGPNNDGKDPFVAEGLAMPWKWNTGNHDVLVQGNLPVSDATKLTVVGEYANGGTRDYRQGGASVSGEIVPDPKRVLLDRKELMAKVASDKDGHGLGDAQKESGRATYTFDAEGTPFRFLVIDTAHEVGGSDGVIKQSYADSTIKPLLDQALAEGKYVILASHHATSSLTVDGGTFGTKEPDAMLEAQWLAFLAPYPNVLFSMVGHSHEHRVRALTAGTHPYWEVMTAAIADFPHQFRVVEIFDQDNGWLMMRATAVDLATQDDAVVDLARKKGTVDLTSGWQPDDGRGKVEDRNVELWIPKPTSPK